MEFSSIPLESLAVAVFEISGNFSLCISQGPVGGEGPRGEVGAEGERVSCIHCCWTKLR